MQRADGHGATGGGPGHGREHGRPRDHGRVGIREHEHGVLRQHLLAVEKLADLPHAGPGLRPALAAHHAEPQHQLRLPGVVAPVQPRIHGAQQVAVQPAVPDPPHQDHVRRLARLDGPAAARDLEQQRAEGEDVGGRGGAAGHGELRGHVPQGAGHARGARGRAVLVEARQAEVAEPRGHVGAEQHVVGLHVAVHHHVLPLLVQVQQAARHAPDGVEPLRPREHLVAPAEQVRVEAAVGYEVVDEEQVLAVLAPPAQLHQVAVPHPPQARDLRHELPHPLLGAAGDPLDGHLLAGPGPGAGPTASEHAFVHVAETARAEKPALLEPLGRLVELDVWNPLGVFELPLLQLVGERRPTPEPERSNHRCGNQGERSRTSHRGEFDDEDLGSRRRSMGWASPLVRKLHARM
uniref:Uncharacterized protein n=1 Tax=Triticum urartu TaxID=4572 RepID=A0A8R7Q694_TRIUA